MRELNSLTHTDSLLLCFFLVRGISPLSLKPPCPVCTSPGITGPLGEAHVDVALREVLGHLEPGRADNPADEEPGRADNSRETARQSYSVCT